MAQLIADRPAAPVASAVPAAGRFDPHRFVALVRRNLALIAAVIGGALAVGLLWAALALPTFVARTRLQIERQADRVLPAGEEPAAGLEQDEERFLQTQTDVLRSRSVAIGVAQALRLFGSAAFHAAMGDGAAGGAGDPAERERVTALLLDRLAVDLPRNSRILTLEFRARDPRVAAAIANGFAQVFIAATLQRRFAGTAYARDFLGNQLVETRTRLERSEQDLNAYARAAGLLAARPALGAGGADATTVPQSVTTASLQQLNAAHDAAAAARIEAEQSWRAAAGAPAMTLPDVLASGAVQALLQQRATLTAELREARERYRGDYPLIGEKAGQIDEVNRQIGQIAGDIRASIRTRYVVAANRERSLAAAVGGLRQASLDEQDRSVRFTVLSREVDTNRALYDGLLARYKQLSAAAGVAASNVSVIDAAEPPLVPASPRPLFDMALALLAGVVLAAVAVVAREGADEVVRDPDDLAGLELAALGAVPRLPPRTDAGLELRQPRSVLVEAYAALRTALLHATPDGPPRSLLVTSAQPGEGKSTSSVAIAASFARLGRQVVLVDADLRRPALQRMLTVTAPAGVTDLLAGTATVAEVAVAVGDGVTLVAAGTPPADPTDLLSDERLPALIRALEAAYDVVVIDGPPVLGLADAPMLAGTARATLFVVEANRSLQGSVRNALRRLGQAEAQLLGGLLTKFDAARAGVGRYYPQTYYAQPQAA